jgi:hypothetical protein
MDEEEQFLKAKSNKRKMKNEFDMFAERTSVFTDICGSLNCSLCFMLLVLVVILCTSAYYLEKGFDSSQDEAV